MEGMGREGLNENGGMERMSLKGKDGMGNEEWDKMGNGQGGKGGIGGMGWE